MSDEDAKSTGDCMGAPNRRWLVTESMDHFFNWQ